MDTETLLLQTVEALTPVWDRVARRNRKLADQGRRALLSAALQYAEGRRARGGNRDCKLHGAYAEAGEAKFAAQLARAAGYLGGDMADDAIDRLDHVTARLYVVKRR